MDSLKRNSIKHDRRMPAFKDCCRWDLSVGKVFMKHGKFSAGFSGTSFDKCSGCLKAISPLFEGTTSFYIRETNSWGSWRNWQTRQVEGLVEVKLRAGSNPVEPIEDATFCKTLRVSAGFVASHFFTSTCKNDWLPRRKSIRWAFS